MSIHSEHPFANADAEKDPVRRLRGRLAAPVTVWTTGSDLASWRGWTISSMIIAEGDPAQVVGLLDADADLAAAVDTTSTVRINLLGAGQSDIAEVFAELAPSPGGPFRTGQWSADSYGPRLAGAAGWLGVRLSPQRDHAGWTLLMRGVVETAEVGEAEPLYHLRGRYRS